MADRLWEDLILAIIGDQFDDCNEEGAEYPEISGCTISVRQYEDIVSLWNRVDADVRLREKIRFVLTSFNNISTISCYIRRDTLRQVLNLPPSTVMEYKSNNGEHLSEPCLARAPLNRL